MALNCKIITKITIIPNISSDFKASITVLNVNGTILTKSHVTHLTISVQLFWYFLFSECSNMISHQQQDGSTFNRYFKALMVSDRSTIAGRWQYHHIVKLRFIESFCNV